MRRRIDIWFYFFVGAIFIVLISAPYLIANQASDSNNVFGGFLFNPIDGNSYLAKMYQGNLGSWQFKFPYTAEKGEGGYIFLYYLALGRLPESIGITFNSTFHAARLIGSLMLLLALWQFYSRALQDQLSRRLAFVFAIFGSGLGWLAVLFGAFTADFWVAEGFPFLSAYANPHFPLGLAILIFLLTPKRKVSSNHQSIGYFRSGLFTAAGALFLSIILPFAVIVAAVVLSGLALWEVLGLRAVTPVHERTLLNTLKGVSSSTSLLSLIWVLIGGLPILIYDLWLTINNPIFTAWNLQNLTVSPPMWDLFISYAPMLFLAFPGAWLALKSKNPSTRVLVVWAVIGALLIYFPWGLQRRFFLGYAIPLSGLASIALHKIFARSIVRGIAVVLVLIVLIIPTNMMIVLGGFQAIAAKDERIYLSKENLLGMEWIASNTDQDSIVLASPQMGLYIPAYTGRTVYYGHPFETANAEKMEAIVTSFFEGTLNEGERLSLWQADYIFYGEKEQELGSLLIEPSYQLVYSSNGVKIYQIDRQSSPPNSQGVLLKSERNS
jgi:hypothetical protein